jgi:hypothetical protein
LAPKHQACSKTAIEQWLLLTVRPSCQYDADQTDDTDEAPEIPFIVFTVKLVHSEVLHYTEYYRNDNQQTANELAHHFPIQAFSSPPLMLFK